jgi:pimeloyl-ACP methyl ester carboxylesterase
MLHFINTSLLNTGYERSGPADGRTAFLLHGWPDDIRTWDAILPELHAAGWQTIVPYLRGFGPTSFLNPDTRRSGQITAFVYDLLELADALGIDKFAVIGHDWGARIAYTVSCFAPERVSHCVALSVAWGKNEPMKLPEEQLHMYWYQWFFGTSLAQERLDKDRNEFTRYIWKIWLTGLDDWQKDFEATSLSFNNPDWVAITLHSYRVRWKLAEKDPQYEDIEQKIQNDLTIRVPVLMLRGDSDPVAVPEMYEGKEKKFKSTYDLRIIAKSGHFPQRESPEEVSDAIRSFLN